MSTQSAKTKTFRVGTYYTPAGKHPRSKPRVDCYTQWYSTSWGGCIEYVVDAVSGDEAKKKAKALRFAHEANVSANQE